MAGGRPTVMTEQVLQNLQDAFSWGATDIEACLYADISERTLYNYQEENPEFVQRKEMLKKHPTLRARRIIHADLEVGKVDTAKWYLERKEKDEFSAKSENKTDLQHLDKDGKPTDPPASKTDQEIINRYLQQKEPTK